MRLTAGEVQDARVGPAGGRGSLAGAEVGREEAWQ